jgi:hypothetical protein
MKLDSPIKREREIKLRRLNRPLPCLVHTSGLLATAKGARD